MDAIEKTTMEKLFGGSQFIFSEVCHKCGVFKKAKRLSSVQHCHSVLRRNQPPRAAGKLSKPRGTLALEAELWLFCVSKSPEQPVAQRGVCWAWGGRACGSCSRSPGAEPSADLAGFLDRCECSEQTGGLEKPQRDGVSNLASFPGRFLYISGSWGDSARPPDRETPLCCQRPPSLADKTGAFSRGFSGNEAWKQTSLRNFNLLWYYLLLM